VVASGQEEVILEEEASGRATMETGVIRTGVRGIVAVPLQKLHMADAAGETFIGKAPELLGLLYLDIRRELPPSPASTGKCSKPWQWKAPP